MPDGATEPTDTTEITAEDTDEVTTEVAAPDTTQDADTTEDTDVDTAEGTDDSTAESVAKPVKSAESATESATESPVRPARLARPAAYWGLSVLAVVCSLLFGAIGLYQSAQVGPRWADGDAAGARRASRSALVLDLVGILGAVAIVTLLVTTNRR